MGTCVGEKTCRICKTTKPLGEFNREAARKDGYKNECRKCAQAYMAKWRKHRQEHYSAYMRDYQYRQRYGVTLADYETLHNEQDGKCAICKGTPSGLGATERRLHVDHDHLTGAVRGLLCENCNRGVGMFQDNPDLLTLAAAYLLQPPAIERKESQMTLNAVEDTAGASPSIKG